MVSGKREISKEIYDRAMENRGYITSGDMDTVFSEAELCGYGIYGAKAAEEDGKYYCHFSMGSSCD